MTGTIGRIEGFRRLGDGWHYGEGGPIPGRVIADAIALHRVMLGAGWTRTEAFPGADRVILVAAYHGPHDVEVIVEPDDSFLLVHEEGDIERRNLRSTSRPEVEAALREIALEIGATRPNGSAGEQESQAHADKQGADQHCQEEGHVDVAGVSTEIVADDAGDDEHETDQGIHDDESGSRPLASL